MPAVAAAGALAAAGMPAVVAGMPAVVAGKLVAARTVVGMPAGHVELGAHIGRLSAADSHRPQGPVRGDDQAECALQHIAVAVALRVARQVAPVADSDCEPNTAQVPHILDIVAFEGEIGKVYCIVRTC